MIIPVGGGGAGLNFSIVGGTTQPTGKENLIWVNTSTTITSWVFSATQPTSPVAGMVWLVEGTSSPVAFNAIKKNGIWMYPQNCSQYVSGAWVAKTAKIYQSGSWKDFYKYFYKNGVFTEMGGVDTAGTASVNQSNIQIGSNFDGSLLSAKNAINLAPYSTLVIKCHVTEYSRDYGRIGIASSKVNARGTGDFYKFVAYQVYRDSPFDDITLDVSNISTGWFAAAGVMNATITEIYAY